MPIGIISRQTFLPLFALSVCVSVKIAPSADVTDQTETQSAVNLLVNQSGCIFRILKIHRKLSDV